MMNNDFFNSKKILTYMLCVIFLFLSYSFYNHARAIVRYDETSDFSAYFSAYTIKKDFGHGIYSRENFAKSEFSKTVKGDIREYLYTPLLAELLSSFMPQDYTKARLIWLLIEHVALFLLLVVSFYLSVVKYEFDPGVAMFFLIIVLISYSPAQRSFHYGQFSIIMSFLLFLSIVMRQIGRPYIGTFFAALGAVIKIYPIVYLFALLFKGKFREVLVMILFLISIPLLFMFYFGADDWINYISIQLQTSYFNSGNSDSYPLLYDTEGYLSYVPTIIYGLPNYSPTALLFLLSDQFGWNLSQVESWHLILFVVLSISIILVIYKFKKIYSEMDFLVLLGLGLCVISFITPLLWNHLFVLFFPFFVIFAHHAFANNLSKSSLFYLYFISFTLISFPDFLVNAQFTNNSLLIFLKYTKLYGLIALSFFLLMLESPKKKYVDF